MHRTKGEEGEDVDYLLSDGSRRDLGAGRARTE
jgi:hypothetical protein